MYTQDYLMRLILQFVVAIRRVLEKPEQDPLSAAASLEAAVARAIDFDADTLLRLEPESVAAVLQASGIDQGLAGYLAHSLALEACYLEAAGESGAADLRRRQAAALAEVFGFDAPATDFDAVAAVFATE